MKTVLLIALIAISACYDRSKAKAYADQHWDSPNHKCGSNYLNCSPYAYFGSEACGYSSHGGDCANFVSQCLIAGGHSKLTSGECRGYPCGKEEPGATRLAHCLAKNYGWKRTCGKNQKPPSNIAVGDVVVYHASGCDDYTAHATIVTSVSGSDVKVTCHSSKKHNAAYTYITGSKPYIEWLHKA